MGFQKIFRENKEKQRAKGLLRELIVPRGVDFCSNDYLGFARDRKLLDAFRNRLAQYNEWGSTSSRLIRGQSEELFQFEKKLAHRHHRESTLFFPSGYQANLGIWSSFKDLNVCIFSDERVHASIIDGIRLSKCKKQIFKHNDLSDLDQHLSRVGNFSLKVIAVESLYSMTGERAPLNLLLDLADSHGAHVIVDEAHSTGLFGARGLGLVEELNLTSRVWATVHTVGKALGGAGAWVALSGEFREHLANQSRPFIYSTAPSLGQWLWLDVALGYWDQFGYALAQKSMSNLQEIKNQLNHRGYESLLTYGESQNLSPICPLVMGDNDKALAVSKKMSDVGFDLRAIRPPTVPEGEALLRLTCPGARTDGEVQNFIEQIINFL